jgi:hypothetical protein
MDAFKAESQIFQVLTSAVSDVIKNFGGVSADNGAQLAAAADTLQASVHGLVDVSRCFVDRRLVVLRSLDCGLRRTPVTPGISRQGNRD